MRRAGSYAYDPINVAAILCTNRVHRNVHPTDRIEVIRRLAARKWSDGQIAYKLDMWRRSVSRIRSQYGIPGLPVGTSGASRPVQNVPTKFDRKHADGN